MLKFVPVVLPVGNSAMKSINFSTRRDVPIWRTAAKECCGLRAELEEERSEKVGLASIH